MELFEILVHEEAGLAGAAADVHRLKIFQLVNRCIFLEYAIQVFHSVVVCDQRVMLDHRFLVVRENVIGASPSRIQIEFVMLN